MFSSFNSITANELSKSGFNIVIYANQLMRASYKSMYNVAKNFKKHRTKEIGRFIDIKKF